MKKILMFSLMFVMANGVFAANKEALNSAEELLSLSGIENSFTADVMVANEIQRNPALAPFKDIMKDFFIKYSDYEKIKPEILSLYAEAFSAKELSQIVAFYKTPAGKKLISSMPELMKEVSKIGSARMQANIGELQAAIQAEMESMNSGSQEFTQMQPGSAAASGKAQ